MYLANLVWVWLGLVYTHREKRGARERTKGQGRIRELREGREG